MKNSFKSLTFFIGIEVFKLTLDVTVLAPKSSTKKYKQISNTVAGLKKEILCGRKSRVAFYGCGQRY